MLSKLPNQQDANTSHPPTTLHIGIIIILVLMGGFSAGYLMTHQPSLTLNISNNTNQTPNTTSQLNNSNPSTNNQNTPSAISNSNQQNDQSNSATDQNNNQNNANTDQKITRVITIIINQITKIIPILITKDPSSEKQSQ